MCHVGVFVFLSLNTISNILISSNNHVNYCIQLAVAALATALTTARMEMLAA